MTAFAAAIAFVLDNWKVLLAALLLALVALFFSLWRSEVKAFAEFKTKVEARGMAQNDKAKTTNKMQNLTTLETEAQYEQGTDAITAIYGPGRVQQRSGGGKLPGISKSPKKPDASAPNARSGAAVPSPVESAECQGLKSDAASTTRQLLFLQDWIERQGQIPR